MSANSPNPPHIEDSEPAQARAEVAVPASDPVAQAIRRGFDAAAIRVESLPPTLSPSERRETLRNEAAASRHP